MPNVMLNQNRHGDVLKLHRDSAFGEVSIARPMLETTGKMPMLETGTAHAINYLRLGVAANLTSSTGRGGARNHASRESHALTAAQIAAGGRIALKRYGEGDWSLHRSDEQGVGEAWQPDGMALGA